MRQWLAGISAKLRHRQRHRGCGHRQPQCTAAGGLRRKHRRRLDNHPCLRSNWPSRRVEPSALN